MFFADSGAMPAPGVVTVQEYGSSPRLGLACSRRKPPGFYTSANSVEIRARRGVVFVETKRYLGADEEPYSCTVTIPDDDSAQVSAKNTTLLNEHQRALGNG